MPTSNCPFYGQHMAFMMHLPELAEMLNPQTRIMRPDFAPFHLIATEGNECAYITGSHAPCAEEIAGRPVDWRTCELLRGRLLIGGTPGDHLG